MKLVVAIVQEQDRNKLSDAFYEADIRATKLSSTGGFLRSGNTTFLIGIEEERLQEVLNLIEVSCQAREHYIPSPVTLNTSLDVSSIYPVRVPVGGATVFVLPIESFYQF